MAATDLTLPACLRTEASRLRDVGVMARSPSWDARGLQCPVAHLGKHTYDVCARPDSHRSRVSGRRRAWSGRRGGLIRGTGVRVVSRCGLLRAEGEDLLG